jgi:hypothetical protein
MRISLPCSILTLLLPVLGCNPQSIASSGSTVLKGPDAAIGGVNLQNNQQPSSITWDKHITSCHYDRAMKELIFGGDGKEYIRLASDASSPRATLQGPLGALLFEGDACTVYKVKTLQQAPPFDGSISIVCNKEHQDLTASVRFERCGA